MRPALAESINRNTVGANEEAVPAFLAIICPYYTIHFPVILKVLLFRIVKLLYLNAKLGAVALCLCLVKFVSLYSFFVVEHLTTFKLLVRLSERVYFFGFHAQIVDFPPIHSYASSIYSLDSIKCRLSIS